MLRIPSKKRYDDDYINGCLSICMNLGLSLEEVLEMPASRWLVIQEYLDKAKKKMERENKRRKR